MRSSAALILGVLAFAGCGVSGDPDGISESQAASTIFTTQTTPTTTQNDGSAIELGVKFRSSAAGYITGVRFYKTTGNAGTHTGELYSSTGTRLAPRTTAHQ